MCLNGQKMNDATLRLTRWKKTRFAHMFCKRMFKCKHTYMKMQWAAVSTHWLLMSVPPQMWALCEPTLKCKLICQGQNPAEALVPPTTLGDSIVFRGAIPQSDRATTIGCQNTITVAWLLCSGCFLWFIGFTSKRLFLPSAADPVG